MSVVMSMEGEEGWCGGSYKQRESGDWSMDNWVWSISEWSLTRPQSLRVASPSQSTTFTPFHLILDPHGRVVVTSSIHTATFSFYTRKNVLWTDIPWGVSSVGLSVILNSLQWEYYEVWLLYFEKNLRMTNIIQSYTC